MKKSLFNIEIPFQDKCILFNTLSQKTIILNKQLIDLYLNNWDKIVTLHPTLYSALVENCMFISDAEEELTKAKELIHNTDFSEESYRLIINPTMDCNFKCWYCYENHIKGSRMDTKTVENIKKLISKILNEKKIKEFRLSFFGGEPLLYFDQVIKPIIQYSAKLTQYKEVKLITHITSNGYLLTSTSLATIEKLHIDSFQITLDGDRKTHDTIRYITLEQGSYNKIISNIKALISIGVQVILRMNYTLQNIDGMKSIIEDLCNLSEIEKTKIIFSLNHVWQDKENKSNELNEKVSKIKDYAKENGFSTGSVLRSDTVRYSCYADKFNQAVINYNGLVYKCNARNFIPDNAEGVLSDTGEIEWNSKFYKRMDAKLKNKPCLNCPIMPMCGGGCRQKALENENKEYCLFDYDFNKKREFIKDYLFNDTLEFTKK